MTILAKRPHKLHELWNLTAVKGEERVITKSTIVQVLNELIKLKYVEKVSRGEYALTDVGRILVDEDSA